MRSTFYARARFVIVIHEIYAAFGLILSLPAHLYYHSFSQRRDEILYSMNLKVNKHGTTSCTLYLYNQVRDQYARSFDVHNNGTFLEGHTTGSTRPTFELLFAKSGKKTMAPTQSRDSIDHENQSRFLQSDFSYSHLRFRARQPLALRCAGD